MGQPPENTGAAGHQLAVVAYRDGQLYCTEEAEEAEEQGRREGRKEGRKEGDRGKSYNHHTDGGEQTKKRKRR